MKPYDLSEPFAQVESDLDVCDYTDAETPAAALAKRMETMYPEGMPFEEVAQNLIRHERNLSVEEAALTDEIKRLAAKLGHVENRREAVRDYLRGLMLTHGQRRVKTPIATASISAGRERIVVAEDVRLYLWPTDVVARCTEKIPPKILKDRLARLDPDELRSLPGVSVEVGEDYLVIK